MDIRKVKKLIELLEESNIGEIEIKEGEESVRISRHRRHACMPDRRHALRRPARRAHAAAPAARRRRRRRRRRPPSTARPGGDFADGGHVLPPPSPGASRSSKWAAKSRSATFCIIEAMKMMNQIEADKAGHVAAMLVENGEPVNSAKRCSSSNSRDVPHARESAHRQPRRNRAARLARLPELGIKTVAVHSKADRNLKHVLLADETVCIGPPPSRESYLNMPAIISAAEVTGATPSIPAMASWPKTPTSPSA